MKKVKALILLAGLGSLTTTAVFPIVLLTNRFSTTFKSNENQSNINNENTDTTFDDSLKDSNQGFESISVLKLNKELGTIADLSEQKIEEKIYEVNPQIEDKKIYLKTLTLNKVKYTVENYTGTFDSNFTITSLSSLIKIKELGKIRDVKSTTIIEKIKEKNPLLSAVSFDNEIEFKITGLNKIEMSLVNQNEGDSIELSYKCVSIGGLFWNNELGSIDNISEKSISNKIINLNNHLDFLTDNNYQLKFKDTNSQTVTNVKMKLYYENDVIAFDEVDEMDVKYNVNSIEKVIQNLDLGEIDDVSDQTILERVGSLNPIFKNSNFENKTTFKNKSLTTATFETQNLEGRVTVNFTIKNLSGLLLNDKIGDITNFSEDEVVNRELLIQGLKTTNTILKDLPNSAIEIIISPNRDPYEINDQYITGNSFILKLAGYNGEMTFSFRIKRTNISNFLPTTNLGNIYWTKVEDVIQIIKDKNGASFNEKEIVFSTPTYTGIEVTAKEGSLNYFGKLNVVYTTRFLKTTGFNFTNGIGGNVSTDLFVANQTVPSSNIFTQVKSSSESSVEVKYAIPNGYDNLLNSSYNNLLINLSVNAESVYAYSKIGSGDLSKARLNLNISKPIDQITTSYSTESVIGTNKFDLSFRTTNWLGACSTKTSVYNYTTISKYQIARETIDGISYFKIKIIFNSTSSDWSYCDSAVGNYSVTIQNFDIN